MRERETHQKNMKNQPKSIPKTMKNQYKFHARKSDAKNIEKLKNLSRKESRKSRKNDKKSSDK